MRDKSAVELLLWWSYIASQYLTLHTFVQQLFCYLQLLKRNARPNLQTIHTLSKPSEQRSHLFIEIWWRKSRSANMTDHLGTCEHLNLTNWKSKVWNAANPIATQMELKLLFCLEMKYFMNSHPFRILFLWNELQSVSFYSD